MPSKLFVGQYDTLNGRSVIVEDITVTEPDVGVVVLGKRVVVACFDGSRVLAELETFVPEPAS